MSNKIFVGNLAWKLSEEELEGMFTPFGSVEECSIITERHTGRSRGFAFVTFSDEAAAKKAVDEMNGKELDGRAMNINLADNKKHA